MSGGAELRLPTYAIILYIVFMPNHVSAWGAKGHMAVGEIADSKLGPHAKSAVQSLIGMTLEQAGPWLDCVKDVKGAMGSLHYLEDPTYGEGCATFWNAPSEREIVSFASRNWDNCGSWNDRNPCHSQYHFADVDISPTQPSYRLGLSGTNDHDVVQSIDAAIAVLQDKTVPAPFTDRVTKHEALYLLVHLVGDLHQPLHVGSIYLASDGTEISATTGEEGSDTGFNRGGNWIYVGPKSLHSHWDTVSGNTIIKAKSLAQIGSSGAVGSVTDLPAIWATDTVLIAKDELEHLPIEPQTGLHHWPIDDNPSQYAGRIADIQAQQISAAGQHLAQLLNALWP